MNAHFLQILLITFWSLSCYFPCSRELAMLSECELDGFKNCLPIRITGFTWTQCATFLGRRGSQQQSNNSLSVKVWNLVTSNPQGQTCYLWVCWKSWPMWLQGSCLQSMKSNVDWEKLFTTGKKKKKAKVASMFKKGKNSDLGSYRLLSFIPVPRKAMDSSSFVLFQKILRARG